MLAEKVRLLLQGHQQLQFLLLLERQLPESVIRLRQVLLWQKAWE